MQELIATQTILSNPHHALVMTAVLGMISQIDAHLSEPTKKRWPKFVRLIWDLLAGNYRHSRNS